MILHVEGLPADVQELNFDCLIVNRQEGQMSIKQILCDKTVSFICSGHSMYWLILFNKKKLATIVLV